MNATPKTGPLLGASRRTVTPLARGHVLDRCRLIAVAALSILAADASAQGRKNVIPKDQKPISRVFPPPAAEQSRPGTGKFVLFTREPVGKDWDFIAGAWECIPSLPDRPVTKRAEFCHSSWHGTPLLDALVRDDSQGMHPRFVGLQVDSHDDQAYTVNLYDINYRTWDVRCIWQGSRLSGFGVLGDSIFCRGAKGWLLLPTASGKLSGEVPFTPLDTDGGFWLVRKPGEAEGRWSYDRIKGQYIAHFGPVDPPEVGFSRSKLSPDGKSLAWVLAPMPRDWQGGEIAGRLILQRNGEKEDISVPVQFLAVAGSGVPVIPAGIHLAFSPAGTLQFRAWTAEREAKDRIWTIDTATGNVRTEVAPHAPPAEEEGAFLGGVPVPAYLRKDIDKLGHFGRGGLAPAFLLHLGILRERPEYPDCTVGASRDGRHVLYQARKGPLAGEIIYGDLLTKQTVRWKAPAELDSDALAEFVWVETP
jgi:hypothetical protein